MTQVTTRWYRYSQNNSGGRMDIDPAIGIGEAVFVEAIDSYHANSRAERIGLYFDGVEDGQDCGCCGDRWCSAYDEYDGYDRPFFVRFYDPTYAHPIEGPFYLVTD